MALELEFSASTASGSQWNYFDSYVKADGRNDEERNICAKKLEDRSREWWDRFELQKCIFVHIPKNAGTSVEEILIGCTTSPQSQHFTSVELRQQNPELFDKLYSFCIVRNPYDRFLSAYEYLINGGNRRESGTDLQWQKKLLALGDFSAFVKHYFASGEPPWGSMVLPSHFIPQYLFLCDETGVILVDCCLPFDQFIKRGLSALVDQGRISISSHHHTAPSTTIFESPTVPHLRKSNAHRSAGYDADGKIADLVYAAYKRDFELLGFDRDSWKLWLQNE